ncbi:hypothetical protein [Phenylobacterium sp.]|uniref:hypothetical protein n=1 Tax=Phenylobacterium sp. TaxID=1871053 RepID=UPI0037832BCE
MEQAARGLYEANTGHSDWQDLPPETRGVVREVSRRLLSAYYFGRIRWTPPPA